MKDTDFLFLTSLLRARETLMLTKDRIGRMLEARDFDDAAKMLIDCGYADMSGMDSARIEGILQKRRSDVYYELGSYKYALGLIDLFRMKYDYHNAKVLVKSAGSGADTSSMLSNSGRVEPEKLSEAFVSGEKSGIPPLLAEAMTSAASVLSRTGNPQLSDIEIDKAYFKELLSLSQSLEDDFITEYVKLLIDSANLRILVRSVRTGRDANFLGMALVPGGSVGVDSLEASFGNNSLAAFNGSALEASAKLGEEAMKGGTQTAFELACDNAALKHFEGTFFISFGPAPVFAYLGKLEWEITAIRMILTGKLTGISADVIRERLRDCHV